MKTIILIIAFLMAQCRNQELAAQTSDKLNDNIAEYIDSMESNITTKLDTLITFYINASHDDSALRSFPVQIRFNKTNQLVSVLLTDSQPESKTNYWFKNEVYVTKTISKSLPSGARDIYVMNFLSSFDESLINSTLKFSMNYRRRIASNQR